MQLAAAIAVCLAVLLVIMDLALHDDGPAGKIAGVLVPLIVAAACASVFVGVAWWGGLIKF